MTGDATGYKEAAIMIAWKSFFIVAAVLLAASTPARAERHTPSLPMAQLDDQGMHSLKWFSQSTFDLREDLALAEGEGKRLVIIWEQKDCLYCKSMYEVNLRIPRVIEKITKNFKVVKLDIWGERKITDLDGTIQTEKDLARTYRIEFTPTLQFLAETLEKSAGKNGKESEAFRIEGYFKPFHFYFLFHYVLTKGYESEPNFQRWLGNIGRGLQENNIIYDLWADALPHNLPDKY